MATNGAATSVGRLFHTRGAAAPNRRLVTAAEHKKGQNGTGCVQEQKNRLADGATDAAYVTQSCETTGHGP